jgi:TetR/AcrR family transcriptional regulator, cholesterol catabolism regulator
MNGHLNPAGFEEKDAALKLRILRSCKELFFKFGVRSVTMDDIASALGMSKKTIYQYYPNKDSIVEAMVHEHLCDSEAEMKEILATAKDPIDALLTSMRMNAQQFEMMNPALIPELKKYFHDTWQHLHAFECNQWIGLLVNLIEEGKAQGIFREDVNAELLALMHTEAFDTVIFSDNPLLTKYSYAERLAIHEMALIYCLVNDKGRELLEHYQRQNEPTPQAKFVLGNYDKPKQTPTTTPTT